MTKVRIADLLASSPVDPTAHLDPDRVRRHADRLDDLPSGGCLPHRTGTDPGRWLPSGRRRPGSRAGHHRGRDPTRFRPRRVAVRRDHRSQATRAEPGGNHATAPTAIGWSLGPGLGPGSRGQRPATAHHQARRPRARSSWRRSRLVGRPAPAPRQPTPGRGSRGGGGGLRSTRHAAASSAPTRLPGSRATSTTRSRPPSRARTVSPTWTGAAGFTRTPLTCTCPARQACAANDRVFASRTVHSQRSTLVPSMPRW